MRLPQVGNTDRHYQCCIVYGIQKGESGVARISRNGRAHRLHDDDFAAMRLPQVGNVPKSY